MLCYNKNNSSKGAALTMYAVNSATICKSDNWF